MDDATPEAIEAYLLLQPDWVSCRWLCTHFEISERRLRALGAGFLVSRAVGGYIHRDYATREELHAYCGPKKAHAISEYRSVKKLQRDYKPKPRPVFKNPYAGHLGSLL